jgi:hypothetical protein
LDVASRERHEEAAVNAARHTIRVTPDTAGVRQPLVSGIEAASADRSRYQ